MLSFAAQEKGNVIYYTVHFDIIVLLVLNRTFLFPPPTYQILISQENIAMRKHAESYKA